MYRVNDNQRPNRLSGAGAKSLVGSIRSGMGEDELNSDTSRNLIREAAGSISAAIEKNTIELQSLVSVNGETSNGLQTLIKMMIDSQEKTGKELTLAMGDIVAQLEIIKETAGEFSGKLDELLNLTVSIETISQNQEARSEQAIASSSKTGLDDGGLWDEQAIAWAAAPIDRSIAGENIKTSTSNGITNSIDNTFESGVDEKTESEEDLDSMSKSLKKIEKGDSEGAIADMAIVGIMVAALEGIKWGMDKLVEKEEISDAIESGLFNRNWVGASKIDDDILAKTTDAGQLKAILEDKDLSKKDHGTVLARLKKLDPNTDYSGLEAKNNDSDFVRPYNFEKDWENPSEPPSEGEAGGDSLLDRSKGEGQIYEGTVDRSSRVINTSRMPDDNNFDFSSGMSGLLEEFDDPDALKKVLQRGYLSSDDAVLVQEKINELESLNSVSDSSMSNAISITTEKNDVANEKQWTVVNNNVTNNNSRPGQQGQGFDVAINIFDKNSPHDQKLWTMTS